MAISFATVFADFGKVLAAFVNLDSFAAKTAPTASAKWGTSGPVIKDQGTMYSDVETRLAGSGLTGLLPGSRLLPALTGLDQTIQQAKQACIADLTSIFITRVTNDVNLPNAQFSTCFVEFFRQQKSASSTVNQSTMGSSVSAGANNTGNATIVVGTTDQNGATLEYAIPENLIVKCTQDRFSGGTAGQEQCGIVGQALQNPLSYTYLTTPGSGASGNLTVVDPTQGNAGGNLLTGGSATAGAFKAWSGGQPTGWVVNVDGANVTDGTTSNYSGVAHCLQFTGNTGGTNLQTEVYQNFTNGAITGGSSQAITPNTVYLFYMQLKASVVPAAGVIKVSLTDGSGTVINDNAGNANTITITVSGLGNTNYNAQSGSFRTPTVMPANVRLRIKATTPITTGSNVFMDFVALSQPSASIIGGLYAGGPFISIFRGSADLIRWVNYAVGDTWTVAITNSLFSSITPSFQTTMNRMLGLASLGFVLNSSGAPTIADTLIS